MKRLRPVALYLSSIVALVLTVTTLAQGAATTSTCASTDPFCFTPQLQATSARLDAVNVPKIATPAWLSAQGGQSQSSAARDVTYVIATKGTVSASVDEFATQVNQTLISPQGW